MFGKYWEENVGNGKNLRPPPSILFFRQMISGYVAPYMGATTGYCDPGSPILQYPVGSATAYKCPVTHQNCFVARRNLLGSPQYSYPVAVTAQLPCYRVIALVLPTSQASWLGLGLYISSLHPGYPAASQALDTLDTPGVSPYSEVTLRQGNHNGAARLGHFRSILG